MQQQFDFVSFGDLRAKYLAWHTLFGAYPSVRLWDKWEDKDGNVIDFTDDLSFSCRKVLKQHVQVASVVDYDILEQNKLPLVWLVKPVANAVVVMSTYRDGDY